MDLEITKDNYKGYLEFYLAADKERTEKFAKTIFIFGISYLLAFILILISSILSIGIVVCSTIYVFKSTKKLVNKYEISDNVKNSIIEKYPYINTEIKYQELYQILSNQGIIKKENVEFQSIREQEFLNYIECEEIKQEVINQKSYDIINLKPVISDKELDKTKTKVKKLIYPAPYSGKR